MRITNSIMNNNIKNGININKANEDKLNTMIASGQKITRPSDDPIIAIRALRLNSSISQVNQYYDKNIEDADAWLEITDTALDQVNSVLEDIVGSLTTGASDDNEAEDRLNILEDLSALRDQIYAAGNADYAGRTVFTGYRTGETLTFTEDTTNLYTITELFDASDVECITYISGSIDINKSDLSNANTEQDIQSNDVYRIRLAYDNLTGDQEDQDGNALPTEITVDGTSYTVTTVSLTGDSATDDAYYTTIGADEVRLIADTGELILGENVRKAIQGTTGSVSFQYAKEEFDKGDLRPEHYFTCTDEDKINYNSPSFENKSISYEISFNQSITINTNANTVFTHDIGRDVDELVAATQAVVDCDEKIATLESMQSDSQYTEAEQETITEMLAAATKELELLEDKMQKMFSQGLTSFEGYMEDVNLAIARVGSKCSRLELTKERVGEQLSSLKELADSNININLTDAGVDLKAATLALEAAQLAASKIAQQTLLNYL